MSFLHDDLGTVSDGIVTQDIRIRAACWLRIASACVAHAGSALYTGLYPEYATGLVAIPIAPRAKMSCAYAALGIRTDD